MAMLRLNYADGRRLIIPAQTIKAIQGASAKLVESNPDARSGIYYLMSGHIRYAGLRESVSAVKGMIDKDKVADAEWFEVENGEGLPFIMQTDGIRGLSALDPESPAKGAPEASIGCSLQIDLELAPGVCVVVYGHGDADEIASIIEPEAIKRAPTPPARRQNRKA
jgi:hypothetical protein